jgi:hypothetical protein
MRRCDCRQAIGLHIKWNQIAGLRTHAEAISEAISGAISLLQRHHKEGGEETKEKCDLTGQRHGFVVKLV